MRTIFHLGALATLAVAACALPACVIDEASNPTPRCTEGGPPCADGRVCYRGFCVLGDSVDGGMDGGADAGIDAPIPPDGAPDVPTDVTPDSPPAMCAAELCGEPTDLALDDDCDMQIDEGCPCVTGTPCYPGDPAQIGTGECVAGTLTCGTPNVCTGAVVSTAETCDNPLADDDCDGTEDNVPGTAMVCTDADQMGVCRTGVSQCASGAIECVTPGPVTETCDGTDDDCDGDIDNGFDLMTDAANCGSCGNDCGPGGVCCMGMCRDGRTDVTNCGGCGTVCGASEPECCGSTCRPAGGCAACVPTCTGGDSCCGGTCYDLESDEENCGECGNACGDGQLCCGGECFDEGPDHCGGACNDCGEFGLCCGGACVPDDFRNCDACGEVCESGTACCLDGCQTLGTNANCGTCGDACGGSTPQCTNGHCCPTGQTWCDGGGCVDTRSNPSFCGNCSTRCGGLTPNCISSTCRLL